MSTPLAAAGEIRWPRSETAGFIPGPEQFALRESLRALLGKRGDITQVREASSTERGFSASLWQALVDDMSVTRLAVPEDRGGLGYGVAELATILEECGRALVCEPVFSSAVLGVQALLLTRPDDDLLEGVLGGDLLATVSALDATTDDLRASRTSAGWVVDGTVTHLTCGGDADVVVASADSQDGRRLFALRPGRDCVRTERTVLDPTRRQADVTLRGARAVALTEPGETAAAATRLRDLGALALASENTGIVDMLLEMTVAYTSTRRQFDRAIGSFQAVKHRLADLLVLLERARSASRYAAAAFAQDPDAARLAVAVAGAVCTDAAVQAAAEAVQLHGGIGFTWEHPAHSYFRRAMGNEAAQGGSRTHRATIAALVGL
ncbi:acyl-CoA/acyl-ACP dehydrogenase [Nocardia sp. NEAU-G5]|uniref:Acyl-CoA/acyl-ACP dehydrogenase n=1 Tax=Nocardia albiluteola TaxID=2842303 RepID=A0ABS6BBN9_9NOCA|nr:acyl-CoA dehydrogenase family protein [Nocardia albiluteola]MBU3067689.1 acyl-CoA/acyl-ACP dehydrogenase [Nocardia albiluteola]